MPNLADLTDYTPVPSNIPKVYITGNSDPMGNATGFEAPSADVPTQPSVVDRVTNRLLGINGEERYQLWPEKVVRSALTTIPEGMAGKIPQWEVDPETGAVHTSQEMIGRAMDMASLAGTGGLAGATDATLGATPFLRPALKYKDRLYKGKEGQGHQDVIPDALYPEFQKMAMSGEDISHYNFGFVNDKGHFLNRDDALKYGIDTGIIDPQADKFGALTSTMMADSSKPGIAIESLAKTKPMESLIAKKNNVQMTGDAEVLKNPTQKDISRLAKENKEIRTFTDKEGNLFAWDASKGTHEGIASSLGTQIGNWGNVWSKSGNKLITDMSTEAKGEGYPSWLKDGMLLSDSSKPGTAIEAMAKTADPFYSALEHNVSQIKQAKMTGDQWLGTLSNKPGVKPEELDWTGLKDYLTENKGKPVTKEQIEQHLAANKVELKEVNKGGKNDVDILAKQLGEAENGVGSWERIGGGGQEHYYRDAKRQLKKDRFEDSPPTKYHGYQLPGGENYRETLLTLPATKNTLNQFKVINEHGHVESTWTDKAKADAWAAKNNYQVREDASITLNGGYKSSHWDEPNILAHVRMNDRTIDGGKSLHLEEIQSDWHQQGRDKGYRQKEIKTFKPVKQDDGSYVVRSENGTNVAHVSTLEKAQQIADRNNASGVVKEGVPDAPFKKTWHELALKRMIREAAEKGYDKLSWTPGEAQAARYDLSKSIDKLTYNPSTGHLQGFKDSRMVLDNPSVPKDKLPDFVGKEAADKILNKPTSKVGVNSSYHTLENADLKIGGEGMKGFYDSIIPKALEKLGKEHGVKVKSHMLETNPKGWHITPPSETVSGKWMVKSNDYNSKGFQFATEEEAKANLAQNIAGERATKKIHYIDIPQSLKDQAMRKGFPLFSSSHAGFMFTPVDHEPEFKK